VAVLGLIALGIAVALSPTLRSHLRSLATRTVRISIHSTPPGARAYVDDEPCGTTPTETSVPAGPHTLRLVREGFKPHRQDIDAEKAVELAPVLEPLDVSVLVVESEPDGAHVMLDNTHLGPAPVTVRNVEPGPHVVVVGHPPLYNTVVQEVQVPPRETHTVTVRLASRAEEYYRARMAEEPARLGHRVGLIACMLEARRAEEAIAVAVDTAGMLDRAEGPAAEFVQFHGQLRALAAAPVDAAVRGKLLDAVLALFTRLAATRPDDSPAYLPLAGILADAGRFTQFLAACDAAAKTPGAPGIVHIAIARNWMQYGAFDGAIHLLERATTLRPKSASAVALLGEAYQRAGRIDDALKTYAVAEGLTAGASPEKRGHVQTQIARLLVVKGDMAGALARYENSLNLAGKPVDLAAGLVLHYPFDRDATDAGPKGHHGVNHGATAAADGAIGGCLTFDGGSSHVAIPAAATQGLAKGTFALWLRTAEAKAVPRGSYWRNPTVLGVATGDWGSGDFGLMLESGKVAYFHGLTSDSRDMSWFSTLALNDGKWHHVAFVNAGPIVFLYVDGKLAVGQAYHHKYGDATPVGLRADTATGGAVGPAPLFIGAANASFGKDRPASGFKGSIDDVRIWNRALSSAEVAALARR